MKKTIGILTIMVIVLILGMNCSYAITYTQEELDRIDQIYSLTENEDVTNQEIMENLLLPLLERWCEENNVVIKPNTNSQGEQQDGGQLYIGDATKPENMTTTQQILENIGHEIYEQTGDREKYNDILSYFDSGPISDDSLNDPGLDNRQVLSKLLQLKLAENGQVVDENGETDENGEIIFEEPGNQDSEADEPTGEGIENIIGDAVDTVVDTVGGAVGGAVGNIFEKSMDALLGIALYPLKAIILALGGIFNLIIDGIASIGGATNGIISLQDIIYTTTTESAKAGINPVPIVAIDFFNFDNNVTTEIGQIRQGIANWFYVFRNLSIVISLCILIYTGIRMAISSIAEDKAKYKSMITNWFVQMVLVFFMQYIIFFTIGVNNAIVDALNPVLQNDTTNYMAELYKQAWDPLLTVGFGSAIVYCILLGMTFSFLIMYIKRMITIGFLIVISPLVTVTYAIDKMGDSKSQALNTWLKEFVYNILIQPFHCVIYAVFVSTSMNLLTVSNIGNFGAPVFAILCIMFMNKAEDILRKIFAFDKHAKTLGSGLASAAMIGAGLSTVSSLFKKEESTKKTGDAGAMPNIEATHKSYVEQKTIDNQIDEAQQASDKAADKIVQNNNGIQKTARQIEKDRRKNRAIESWQNAGGIGGMAMKGAQMQAKAALPVLSAFLGAGQGNLKSMIGAGTAGYAIERGIENAVEKRAKPSQVELSRQAKANEAALGVIYQEQAQKWTKEGGRWAGFSKEEILNDIKYLATMDNINELKKEDERHFAHVLQEGVSSYAALGQNMPVGDLVEFIRRQQG